MAGQDIDRNEAATAYKLQKARERGSIVKSAEVTFAAVLLAATACIYGLGESTLDQAGELMARGLMFSSRAGWSAQAALAMLNAMAMLALHLLAPLLFVIWVSATMMAALQARGVFSAQPLKADFSRLNPAKSLERLFSIKSVFDLLRNCLKLVLLAAVASFWGRHHLPALVGSQAAPIGSTVNLSLQLAASVFGTAGALYILFAAIDWMFNHWDFARQMRMSKREIKDEHKEREGDPRIKQRLRELRVEWLRRARSVAKVRRADVLVTNPTHYAVALEYRHGDMPAPLISARGAGELALRMREEAQRRGVPVVENPPLARALFRVSGPEAYVPEEYFHDVARILRWIYARRPRTSTRGIA